MKLVSRMLAAPFLLAALLLILAAAVVVLPGLLLHPDSRRAALEEFLKGARK